ncbi:1719_t:CDS:2 [Cetraspora pellucida]|uniref:1719_t:CDS:1 n=1 Tax=Cetraspora pellucida TaxID=1433469 RepID=A0ACA9LXR5_9GLOM|nr:1719_t:CDS:2 [Cetraspora pellucida]
MSAIATKIIEKYNLISKMSMSKLSQYTSEFLKNLTDDRKRNQTRRCLRDGFKFSNEQVSILIPNQRSGKNKTINLVEGSCRIAIALPPKSLEEEIVSEIAKRILQNRYGFSEDQKKAEANRIDYPDHFTLEIVKERLDGYDVSTLPNLQALADVMVMLCICLAELTSLHITDAGVTAKELLTWIQNAISSGRMGDPGAVYGAVVHRAKNPAHLMTIAEECLRHNSCNYTSPVQNYVVVNYRPRNTSPEQAKPF